MSPMIGRLARKLANHPRDLVRIAPAKKSEESLFRFDPKVIQDFDAEDVSLYYATNNFPAIHSSWQINFDAWQTS